MKKIIISIFLLSTTAFADQIQKVDSTTFEEIVAGNPKTINQKNVECIYLDKNVLIFQDHLKKMQDKAMDCHKTIDDAKALGVVEASPADLAVDAGVVKTQNP